MTSIHYCIMCGEAFIPSHADEARCPEHGGRGRLVGEEEIADEPQLTKLDPAGPGEPTRLDDGSEGQPTKMDDGPRGTLVDGDPSLPGEKPPISLGEEGEDGKGDGEPVQTEADVPVKWDIGDRILDLYEVRGVLGKGGFGVVYRVYHTAWDLDLAVKAPLESALKDGGTESLVAEAEDWMDLGLHPHITTCHYVRTLGGVPRVFAELVEGGSLHNWMTKGRLYEGTQEEILKRLLDIAIQFAWGLDYAHEQGMIHQDVKPENALMTEGGSVKVTDFGLVSAKATAGEVTVKAEEKGEKKTVLVKGRGMAPAYCSPEQSMGQLLSRRTDLWSWGLSVLALFAGERFWGEKAGPIGDVSLAHYLEEGPRTAGIPRMPDGLVALLREVFQEDPDKRPHDMDMAAQQVIEVYEEELGEPYPREKPEAAELRADSLNNRALSLMDLGREEEAEEAWEQALQVDPSHSQATYNYGLRRWRSGRIDDLELLRQLSEVVGSQPDSWEAHYLLAMVHLERNDGQGAMKWLESLSSQNAERHQLRELFKKARQIISDSRQNLKTYTGHYTGHNDSVKTVHLSEDQTRVLSGSKAGSLKLWDFEEEKCLHTFPGHEYDIHAVHLNAAGNVALSGSEDKKTLTLRHPDYPKEARQHARNKMKQGHPLKAWNIQSGKCLITFEKYPGLIAHAVYLSRDGNSAFSGGDDKKVRRWDVETGDCLRIFEGHRDAVLAIDLSEDGRVLLSGSGDHSLKLWDVDTGNCLQTFQGHKTAVTAVCLSKNGQHALSGSMKGALKLWRVEKGKCLCTFSGHQRSITSVALSGDSRRVLSGSLDQTARLWDAETGKCIRTFQEQEGQVNVVRLNSAGCKILFGAWERFGKQFNFFQWEVSPDNEMFQSPSALSRVTSGEIASERKMEFRQLLSRIKKKREQDSYRDMARLISLARSIPGYRRNREVLDAWCSLYAHFPRIKFHGGWEDRSFSISDHKRGVVSVSLNRDGRKVFTGGGGWNPAVKLWDVETGKCLRTFEGHEDSVRSVHLSADGRYALSGSSDNTLKLWDIETGKCVRTFQGHESKVESVQLSADGRYGLSGSYDKTLKLWDVKTGKCLRTFEGHDTYVSSVQLSADERFALSGSVDLITGGEATLRLWSVKTGKCLRIFRGHEDSVRSVHLNADGRYALSGSRDNTLKLWDIETGKCLRTFQGHEESVSSVHLSADGRYALSGSYKTLKLWDVETGKCLRTFRGHEGFVIWVNLSPDGRCAFSVSLDNSLKLWFLDWELKTSETADWDEGARPYLENFLILHTPYAGEIPQDREPTEEEVRQALTRQGTPTWTEEDFQGLLTKLGYAGYGWLRPEGVRRKLQELAQEY